MTVRFRFEQQSDKRLVIWMSQLTPRMIAAIHSAMKTWIYQGASVSVSRYFAPSQSVVRGARNDGPLLISRTGTLSRSIVASVDSGMDPSTPGPATLSISAMWGASTPYARIQEMGGYAGRGHRAYIPPRPYLQPALDDERPDLLSALEHAIAVAIRNVHA